MSGHGLFFLAREGKLIGDSASTRLVVAIGNFDKFLDKIHTFQETSGRLLGDTVLGAPLKSASVLGFGATSGVPSLPLLS